VARDGGRAVPVLTVAIWPTAAAGMPMPLPLLPLHDPVALPTSPATMPAMLTPLTMQWSWPPKLPYTYSGRKRC
jgi:hypothetical protein